MSRSSPCILGGLLAFSAIGRNLMEHRVDEIALRARADRPAQSFERPSVAELMQAMVEVAAIRTPGSAGITMPTRPTGRR
jgi:hypothetical protein